MPLSLDVYYRLFQWNCREKRGMEFQTFFESIMRRHDKDFVAIKPRGPEGDRKCDGYSLGGTVYQCYAPEDLRQKDLEAKIRTDLAGAVEHWPRLQRWVFIYAQSDNVYPGTAALLEELSRAYHQVAIECWSSARWWDEVVRRLPLSVLAELFPSDSGLGSPEPESSDATSVTVTEPMYPKARLRLLAGLKNPEVSTAVLTHGVDLFQIGPGGLAEPRTHLGWQRIRLLPFLQRLESAVGSAMANNSAVWRQFLGDLLVFAVDPAWTAQARRNWPTSSIPYHGDVRYTITAAQKTVFFVRLIVCAVCDSPCDWNSLIDTRKESDRCLPDDDHFCAPPLPVVPPNILPSQTPDFVKRTMVSHHFNRGFPDTEAGRLNVDSMFESLRKWMADELEQGRKTYYATHPSYSDDGMDRRLKSAPYSLAAMPIFRANDEVETAMVEDALELPPQLHRLHSLLTSQS